MLPFSVSLFIFISALFIGGRSVAPVTKTDGTPTNNTGRSGTKKAAGSGTKNAAGSGTQNVEVSGTQNMEVSGTKNAGRFDILELFSKSGKKNSELFGMQNAEGLGPQSGQVLYFTAGTLMDKQVNLQQMIKDGWEFSGMTSVKSGDYVYAMVKDSVQQQQLAELLALVKKNAKSIEALNKKIEKLLKERK